MCEVMRSVDLLLEVEEMKEKSAREGGRGE